MRIRKKNWTEGELESNEAFIDDGTQYKGKWNSFFGNSNPIHVEIGCGKGNFLVELASRNKDINYVGVERQRTIIGITARKAALADGKNIALVCSDVNILSDIFAEAEISRLYINFCDPWPKKRWAKRRLTYRSFLKVYESLLTANGEIHFKTDNFILFESSLNEFCGEGWNLKNISLNLHRDEPEDNIRTEYEQKFSYLPIHRLEAYKYRSQV